MPRMRFSRAENVRSWQTGERLTAVAQARMVCLQGELMFKMALQEPTLRRVQIDDVIRNGSTGREWAGAIYPSPQGSGVDHQGFAPPDAAAQALETASRTCRDDLTRNDIAAVQEMAHRRADRPGLNTWTGRLDERLTAAASPSLLGRDAA